MTHLRRRLLLLGAGAAALAGLGGCGAMGARLEDAQDPPAAADVPAPARFALVLGSGGPRGYAHLGVLRVLEEAGLVPDLVVGSSVGALVAVLWAAGLGADELDRLSFAGGPLDLFDISPWADRGWIHGRRLQDYVNARVGQRRLQDLPRRALVVAARRMDKRPQVFGRGNAGLAVRASCAVPGVFAPVTIAGIEYEDGDEVWPVPVTAARAAAARFVLAVDLYPPVAAGDRSESDRMRRRRARIAPELARADFVLNPGLGRDVGPWRRYFVECRRRGEDAARAALPGLRARLEQVG